MIINFKDIKLDQTFVGSKAYILAMMSTYDLPVPKGLILTSLPASEEEWKEVFSWWKSIDFPLLAIRSSAFGEDSKEMSFAGQNQSFLNVKNEEELRSCILKCFHSVDREASKSYRKFFTGTEQSVPMNVVIQEMVHATYSGVYFSKDPTNIDAGAMLEYSEGLGEALVSGQVNPFRVKGSEINPSGPLSKATLKNVFTLGLLVSQKLNEDIDMEWAIDARGILYLLQARPITASRSTFTTQKIINEEYDRIVKSATPETWWDGQTFCEWTGNPSQLSFDVWKQAFAPGGALDLALHELGYIGFVDREFSPHKSILNQLYGRAFVNMGEMLPLYFGPIPYSIEPKPRPHLKFKWSKMSLVGIFSTPFSIGRMLKVAWGLATRRRSYIDSARKNLLDFKVKMQRPESTTIYETWSNSEILNRFEKEINNFSRLSLKWPLVISVLIESTHQSLLAIMESLVPRAEAEKTLKKWMGAGIGTQSFEMQNSFKKAQADFKQRSFFISKYGHRGPGELDLSNPRWMELGDNAFDKNSSSSNENVLTHSELDIENEVKKFKSLKESIILEEWKLLKELLELREQWKMEILRPYAHIRYLCLEIAKRLQLTNDIFNLNIEEIKEALSETKTKVVIHEMINERKLKAKTFKSVYLPETLCFSELKDEVFAQHKGKSSYGGLALSNGLTKGHVRLVSDPNLADLENWPADTILVAPATDPGWTKLLTKVRGVIVERGGVLSHCAIVAREMGLPAINLAHATEILKDGDEIYLDGDRGNISYEPRA